MTSSEIILTITSSFLGAKYVWDFLKQKNANFTKIGLKKLEKEEQDIRLLQSQLKTVQAQLELVRKQNQSLVSSFKVILPLLEVLADDNEGLKSSLSVIKEIVIEHDD